MRKRLLGILLALCLVVGLFPLPAYAWDETGTCEFCGGFIADDWICTGGEHCGENSGRTDCYEEHHCHECWDCETEVDEFCAECLLCVECAQEYGAHCKECGTCFNGNAEPCPGGCDRCGECADEWCSDCGMCVECAIDEGKHCPDCNACHGDGDYCLLCNRCLDCGDQCESGCTDVCLICHLENEKACTNCGACFIVGDNQCCPSCGYCSECVDEWCDNCEMCVECAVDDYKHCPECAKCYEEVENYCGGCGKCLDCADAYCPDCNMCSDCVLLCGNCHYCSNDATICPDCGEACSECGVVCGNCGLCEDCTTICGDCGDYCSDCSTLCGGCQTCEACAVICPDCGEICSSCGTICKACGLCEDCCEENSRMAGCTHGICIMSSEWNSHWSTEHASYEHTHVYGDYLNNASGHWRICKVGSCGASTAIENHSFGYSTVIRSATETQAGLKEYTCTLCSFKSTHTLTYFPAKEATCTGDGNTAYYICSCGKWFNDGAFEEEITDKSDVVLVAGHTASDWKTDKDYHWKECTTIGCGVVLEETKAIHEYGDDNSCDICGYDRSTTYTIIEGANGKWVKGTEKPLAFKADGQISKFEGVKVDDVLIDASKYTAVSGSTIVTLEKEYLDTLSVGVHKLTIVYTDGEAITYFAILTSESGNADHVHALTLVANKAATCTTDGNKAYYTCTCGKWFSDKNDTAEIADYTSVVLPATGHYYKWIIDKVATETEAGSKHLECRYCHDAKEAVEIPAIGNAAVHQHSYVKEIVPPTCTEQGYTEYMCICGSSFKDNYVNAIGHVDADNSGKCDICATNMSAGDPGKTTGTDPSNNAGATDTGKNIDVKSPQTGDSSNLALWIALLFICGGAVIGTTLAGKKRKYNK